MSETHPPILQVQAVSKAYGTVQALDNVSFTLATGFHALLGLNGAGKSTLFQLLSGLFVADSGEISINQQPIRTQLTRALATMGIVFQQSSLDLDLTVQANLNFYGRLHGLCKKHITARSALELDRLGLAEVAHKRCRELSGGNRRKVELARALLTEPTILLMDEATVGLDPGARDSLLHYVHQLGTERSLCVLWATHLIDETETAQHILVLHQGKLLANQTPQALLAETGQSHLLEAFLALTGTQKYPMTSS